MRSKLVAGNWKMNGNLASNQALLKSLIPLLASVTRARCAVCVPYPYLAQTEQILRGQGISWGAQDVCEYEHGAYTGGPRLVTAETKKEMRRMLDEIRSGQYARGWIEENQTGRHWFEGRRREERAHVIERVGADLRALMPFLKPVTITDGDAVSAGARPNG